MKPIFPANSIQWLTLAAVVTSCAIACGIHIFHHPETAASPKIKPAAGRGNRPSDSSLVAAARRTRPALPAENQRLELANPTRKAVAMLKVAGAPPAGMNPVVSEAQWLEQASQVEMEASHELDRLTGLLDLAPSQQNQIFTTLARQSPNWLPGMVAGRDSTAIASRPAKRSSGKHQPTSALPSATGTPAADTSSTSPAVAQNSTPEQLVTRISATSPASVPTSDVTDYLTPEQQQALIQEEMDREAWWASVLPQLLPPALPATKSFDGDEVLLEE